MRRARSQSTGPKSRVRRSGRSGRAAAAASKPGPAAEASAAGAEAGEHEEGVGGSDLAPLVGANLRRLRTAHGLSLERLAAASGVSRAMLGQIELGQSAPTINVLWKISRALAVPFSAFISTRSASGTIVLRGGDAKLLTSKDGSFSSRALFPFNEPRRVEFYELRLTPKGRERAEAHSPGTVENLVVARGALTITVGGEQHALAAGDAIVFTADVPHTYTNPLGHESVAYLVMTYAKAVG